MVAMHIMTDTGRRDDGLLYPYRTIVYGCGELRLRHVLTNFNYRRTAMIDINKKYRTRDGSEVRIYATDGNGKCPVHGAWLMEDGTWLQGAWSCDGVWAHGSVSNLDLIEVREKKKLAGWVNIYPRGTSVLFESSELANKYFLSSRIACKYIEIEYEEGEGL